MTTSPEGRVPLRLIVYANTVERTRLVLPWVRRLSDHFGLEVFLPVPRGARSAELAAVECFGSELPENEALRLQVIQSGEDRPESAILEEAARREADLIILAPAGRRGLQRFVQGSMISHVVRGTRSSVMVVRGGVVPPRGILACVSGSRHSLTNVRMAARLGVAFGSRVTAMMVLSQVPVTAGVAGGADRPDLMQASDFIEADHPLAAHLRTAREMLEGMGATGGVRAAEGLVVDEILREVETFDYDLLVVGTHRAEDYDPMYEDLTSELIRRCRSTTLVVGVRANPL